MRLGFLGIYRAQLNIGFELITVALNPLFTRVGFFILMQMVESVFALAGADVAHSDGYPGWTPNPDSKLLEVTVDAYKRLFDTEPKVRAIHAGLECGLFLEKYPDLEMVSFGPTLRGVHSPDERLEIATVPKFWSLLAEVLKTL